MTLRFLADMGIPQRTVIWLRQQEHDAVHLREEALQELSDDDIVLKAIAERRIILTHDLDFSRIVALRSESLPSVITFRLDDMRAPQVNVHLDQVLQGFDSELERGALVSVRERGIRVRRLPVQRAD
jgi:predicted nuclease of predicted toxin-antitoxin system